MSLFGLTAYNKNTGELTLSADSILFGYLGKAIYQSTTGNGSSTVDSFAGYSTYTFNWPGQILVGVSVVKGYACLKSVSSVGNTWTITVFCSNSTKDTLLFGQQIATDVFVWGSPLPSEATSGFGFVLYKSDGTPGANFLRPPVTYKARISMEANVYSQNIPPVNLPVMVGCPNLGQAASNRPGVSFWVNRIYGGAWSWDQGNNQLNRNFVQTEYFQDDGGIDTYTQAIATNGILIEGLGLN